MLEVTRVKVDGSSELVVHGEMLFVRSDGTLVERQSPTSAAPPVQQTGFSILAEAAVDGLVTLLRAMLQLIFGVLCVVCSELVFPVLREVACALGSGALYVAGAGLQRGGTALLEGSARLRSHSRVLSAGSDLLRSRRRRIAALTVVEK